MQDLIRVLVLSEDQVPQEEATHYLSFLPELQNKIIEEGLTVEITISKGRLNLGPYYMAIMVPLNVEKLQTDHVWCMLPERGENKDNALLLSTRMGLESDMEPDMLNILRSMFEVHGGLNSVSKINNDLYFPIELHLDLFDMLVED